MSTDHMTADATGLTVAEIRACRVLDIPPTRIARERRRRLLADTDQEAPMPDDTLDLTDDEKDICARSGMHPARYAAVRDTPTSFGGRSIADVLAAVKAADAPKED